MDAKQKPTYFTSLLYNLSSPIMEEAPWLILTSIFILFFLFLPNFIFKRHARQGILPPSPPAFPVIGHLHLLKQPLHRSLHKLTEKYGHVYFLRVGTRQILVVSSPSAVEECFTKNDITFANRPDLLAGRYLNYNNKTMGFASYGDHWRNLRRLATLELFSSNRLAMLAGIREEEIKLLVKQLFQEAREGRGSEVELRPKIMELSFNMMLRMISGKRYYGKDVVAQEGKQFQSMMKELAELSGAGHLSDYLPILQWVDFQGVRKKMVKLMKELDSFLQHLLDERKRNRSIGVGSNQGKMTMIDVMLQLQETEPEFYTDENMKGVILVMLAAGTETSATTMEWTMSLLLNHPEVMDKVRAEIDSNVGHDQLLKESDLSKVKYLQNVITETLRLYPVAPLLLPHESSTDCKVCGYDVPRGTMLFVNLWTLQRDANSWVDPERFVPERFEGGEGGEGYKTIPFGTGRRACPGAGLAKRVMAHALGALIQCFEWEPIGHENIDMSEGLGLTMPKVEPLVALCKPRQVMTDVLSKL